MLPTAIRRATARAICDALNARFTCGAERKAADREDLAREVALGRSSQRLGTRIANMIASGVDSAIRRGLITRRGDEVRKVT